MFDNEQLNSKDGYFPIFDFDQQKDPHWTQLSCTSLTQKTAVKSSNVSNKSVMEMFIKSNALFNNFFSKIILFKKKPIELLQYASIKLAFALYLYKVIQHPIKLYVYKPLHIIPDVNHIYDDNGFK